MLLCLIDNSALQKNCMTASKELQSHHNQSVFAFSIDVLYAEVYNTNTIINNNHINYFIGIHK